MTEYTETGYPVPCDTEQWYCYARRELGYEYDAAANIARTGSMFTNRTVSL